MRVWVVAIESTGQNLASALANALRTLAPQQDYLAAFADLDLWRGVEKGDGALLCVTPTARDNEQLFFDLGRLQGAVGSDSFVAPVLVDLSPEDLAQTPLAIFQCTRAQRLDLEALIADLERRGGSAHASSENVDVEHTWQALLQQIGDVPGRGVQPFVITLLLPERLVSFGFDGSGNDASWDDSVGAALRSLAGSPIKPPPFDADTLAALDVETSRWVDRPRRLSRVPSSHFALVSPAVVEEAHGDARVLAHRAREEAARFPEYGGQKVLPWKFLLMGDHKLALMSNVR